MSPATELSAAASPDQTLTAFAGAIAQGDLELATQCFAKDACLVTPDATAIRGREEIRSILAQLIARRTSVEVHARAILVGSEVALASERWRIRSVGSEGATFEQISDPTVVLRNVEGAWKLAILGPWGWGPAGGDRLANSEQRSTTDNPRLT